VAGPIARTVGDIALMLAAMAGPDDRNPLSYEVDATQFTRAVKRPSIKGWRVAWTPDLNGLLPVDEEVRRVAEDAVTVFRKLGARVEAACPAFSEVPDIIRGTRALTMVALHADKLPQWREQMQKDLVSDVEYGLALRTRDIARGELLRSVLWQRVQTFMTTRDLLVLPTVAVPPFPVEQPYPTEINGKPLENYFQWFTLTYAITLTGLPAISVPCGFTRSGLPVGVQIVARRRQEAAVLRAAAAFESAAPWSGSIPSVVAAAPMKR
jgi:amidase